MANPPKVKSCVVSSFLLFLFLGFSQFACVALAKAPALGRDPSVVTHTELVQEVGEKVSRVQKWLKEQGLAGVLLTQVRNFSWITAGLGRSDVVLTSEVGSASLLITSDARKYLVAASDEVPRLMDEDLKDLGFEARDFKWYEDKTRPDRKLAIIHDLTQGQPVGTDVPYGDLKLVDISLLRSELTESEIKKYRWLGRNTTEAVIATARKVHPGMTEQEIEAMTSDELLRRGIRPTVLLIATDDRIYRFRHALPAAAKLKKYAMINVCARKWGLIIAVTRFVHFGPLPPSLKQRLSAVARIGAQFQAHTTPGATAGEILELAKQWYAQNGFPGEWERHHQGGAIGYSEREWLAYPGSRESVHAGQAFAWNPTVEGAKVEDTILAHSDHIENLTLTGAWPQIPVMVDGKTYPQPGILVREAPAASRVGPRTPRSEGDRESP